MSNFSQSHVFGTVFETTDRYTNLQPFGMGTYGLVCSAKDNATQEVVAIKKIVQPFRTCEIAKRTYREIKLLKEIKHENIISLKDIFVGPLQDIYISTEFLSTDLKTILSVRPLEEQFAQYFVYQIFRGLKYLHSAGVVHRDLKPSNILIDENCDLKICDFGTARIHDHQMTGYVSERYYRAPEIMLFWQRYGPQVDTWSAGCIMAEMLQGKPLFPGADHVDQFQSITKVLGTPSEEMIDTIPSKSAQQFVRSLPNYRCTPLKCLFPDCSDNAIDFLERILIFDSEKRIKPEDALSHAYLEPYHDPNDEPSSETMFDWAFQDRELTAESWKAMVHYEVAEFQFLEKKVIMTPESIV